VAYTAKLAGVSWNAIDWVRGENVHALLAAKAWAWLLRLWLAVSAQLHHALCADWLLLRQRIVARGWLCGFCASRLWHVRMAAARRGLCMRQPTYRANGGMRAGMARRGAASAQTAAHKHDGVSRCHRRGDHFFVIGGWL